MTEPEQTAGGGVARSPLERLLRPRSIALAGVSATPGSLGGIVLDNLERFGFQGDIHLIHPRQNALRGRRCVPSVAALPPGVDCVVLVIPVTAVLQAVVECAAHGVGGIVIFSAGFAEVGEEGRRLQEAVAQVAREAGMAIEGPNCIGYVNYIDGIPLTFAIAEPRALGDAGIAVVSQSGAMGSVMRAALHGRALPVSWSISTGNEAAQGLEDFLEFVLADPTSRVAAVVAEHIRDPRRFLALADHAWSLGIPLVLLHSGRSRAAAAAAATHTGALASDFAVMRAHVERHGVLMAETLEEMIDLCELLIRCPARPPTRGVAVIGESGAFKALTLDYAETIGLDLPQPDGDAAAALDAIAPGFVVASNPLDLTGQTINNPALWSRAIEQMLANRACGALVVCGLMTSLEMARRKLPAVIDAMRGATAAHVVIFAMLGEDSPVPEELVAMAREAGIPFFRSPERAFRALARLAAWPSALSRGGEVVPADALPGATIPEYRAKDILEAAGLPMLDRQMAKDLAEAKAAAAALGFPLVLKAQSAALSHKSDVGGVILGIGDADQLVRAWDRLQADVARGAPDIVLDGVLVERMSAAGLELIVGARTDPEWGPVLMIGIGGAMAEALGDVCVIAADLNETEIAGELRQLTGAALLGPFRGRPPRDVPAAAALIARLGRFVRAHPEIAELDINPLVVFAEGAGALLLDALISIR